MQQHDDEFIALAKSVEARLYRTALAMLSNDAAATEAVDETIYRAYLAFGRLRETEYFNTWITRILVNICCDELRRRNRRGILVNEPSVFETDAELISLRHSVASLPDDERLIITLRYYMGYTIVETARITGKPEGTVSTVQRRALERLYEMLHTEDEVEQ